MASLKTYIDSPLFTDGSEVSAVELNILRENAEAIKFASLRSAHVFDINRIITTFPNNSCIWKGGFQYRTGLTTARFSIYTKQVSGQGNHDIVIKFDGVEVHRYDAAVTGLNIGGYTTVDKTINASGYTDFQIITVEIFVEPRAGGTPNANNGTYYVFEAYTFPHSAIAAGTWPGVPTFGAVNGTRLNQLSNGLDYLANRVKNVPYPLSMNMVNWMGTLNPSFRKFKYFKVRFSNQNKKFKTAVYYICHQTQTYIRLTIGSVTWDFGPYTSGQGIMLGIDVDGIAAGLSYDVDYFASLEELVTITNDPSDGHGGFLFSRIWNSALITTADTYSFTAAGPSNAVLETFTYSELKSRLNTIATIVNEAYTNVSTHAAIFDRGYMFRSRYGINQGQDDHWATVFLAGKYREGDVLWVKGQDLKLSYGKYSIKPKVDDKPNDIWEYEFQYEETLLDSSGLQQSYFYLDQFESLHPGMFYYITGKDIQYAAEHLR